MDTGRGYSRMICPPADSGRAAVLPSRGGRTIAVDDRLAPPETRVEYLRGAEIFAAPADEPHASHHSQVDRVVGAHVKKPYAVAVDMLTRVDDASDFAPDVSVYKPIVDRKTKAKVGRELEEIAFEIVDKQSQAVPARKAADLIARGVRRVFCVVVSEQRLAEWSREHERFEPLGPGALIEDPCFVRPIRAEALVSSVLADDEVARALLVKRPRAIKSALAESREEGREEGRQEGRQEGVMEEKQRSILRLLEARGLSVSKRVRSQIEATRDRALLERWFADALSVKKADELVAKKTRRFGR